MMEMLNSLTTVNAYRRVLIGASLGIVLLFWYASIQMFGVSKLIFPDPTDVLISLYAGIASGEYFSHFAVTLFEILAGFVVGSALGFVLGTIVSQFRLVEVVLYPYVVAFQTMPKVAIAPLFIVWFGFGIASKVVITASVAFFPVLTNTIVGLRSAPRDQVDLMIAFTATRWQLFRMVLFPHALPYIFAGLDSGIVLAIIGAIVGEFVGAQAGLGYLILQRNFSMDIAGVFAILIVLSGIGIGLHAVIKAISRKVIFWTDF